MLTVSVLACCSAAPASGAAESREPPDEWDPRLDRYVEFVERTRGLEFEHPVRVRFLGEKAFRDAAASWYEDATEDDRELAAQESADLLALGLVTEPYDALAVSEDSDVVDTLGWYDDERKEMVVRGTDLDDTEVQLTVVHELTHALQDQHFDLLRLNERAETSGEIAAQGALIEGDATLVEYDYLWSLPQRVQDDYWTAVESGGVTAGGGISSPEGDVPTTWPLVYDLWSAFDYDLAPTALEVAIAAHGRKHVDRLFRSPPRSEEAIIDPVALESRDRPQRVSLPPFADGEVARGERDEWGAFSLYLVLSARIPWDQALAAVDGWGGDRYRSYRSTVGGTEQECVRLAVTGDTALDTAELEAATTAWAQTMPAGGARVERRDDTVVVSACATGQAPSSGDVAMQEAYTRLWERTDEMWYLTGRSAPPDALTRCVAGALVADDEIYPLLTVDRELTGKEERAIRRSTDAHVSDCS